MPSSQPTLIHTTTPGTLQTAATAAVRRLTAGPTLARLPACPVICLSHLRWDFVYQRPQHLMTCFGRSHPVLFVEEPVADDHGPHRLEIRNVAPNVCVAVPRLPAAECTPEHPGGEAKIGALVSQWATTNAAPDGEGPILWYYTPMALGIGRHLRPRLVVYDCMDQLANFLHAPPQLVEREAALFEKADLVFTGGQSLFEAKRRQHRQVHLFPSSVDAPHFRSARRAATDPADMAAIARPRIGFFGVLDERLDLGLLGAAAAAAPAWQWVLVGPVVKIDAASLPRAANLHYLGPKSYDALPAYLGRWDVAMMPFVINASTRFISPTKTPEYLAGGCPVVSTPITDVVHTYGDCDAVQIAGDAVAFVAAIERALGTPARSSALCAEADAVIDGLSWDRTQERMTTVMAHRLATLEATRTRRPEAAVRRAGGG